MNRILSLISSKTKKEIRLLLSCFGISAGLMALIYFCIGVPFFGNSVLVLDLNGQYVYFFESLHDIIYNSNASMLYSWCRSLGGEYMGIYAYYLASPFSWLVALMPSAIITESLYVMILFKVGCAGATMGWYLYKTYPTKTRNVLLFSALYALCAWSMMYGNNVMWLDALILFPLVIRGADLLLSGRNYLLYTLALALTLLSHYYIGYMICLFLVLYFFYYHTARNKDEDYNVRRLPMPFILSGLRYLFFTLLAVGIAAIIILPAAYSLTFGKDTFTDPTYEFSFKLTFLDIIYKLLPGATDTVRREGLPFIYCGTASLIGAAIFFVSSKFRTREKAGMASLLLLLCLCFSVSVIDIIWHGGQEPNWLNYRYSFIFSFLLVLIGYRGFSEIENARPTSIALVPAIMGIFMVILQALGYGNDYEYTGSHLPESYDYNLFFYFLGAVIITSTLFGILYYKKNIAKRAGTIALCAVILGECFATGILHQVTLACDVGYSSRNSYTEFIDRVEPAVDAIKELDNGFYRMDKTFYRQPADSMAFEMRGLSSTTSTLNKHTLKLLDQLGYVGGSYWSKYIGGTPVTDMLLNVKYILTEEPSYDNIYQRVYTDEENKVYGYLNPYALSIGYGVSDAILSLDFESYQSPMYLLNDLTVAMTGNEENKCFKELLTSEPILSNISLSHSYSTGHTIYNASDLDGNSTLTFTVTAEESGYHYLFLPTDYPRECNLLIDGKACGTAMGNDSDGIITLGKWEADSVHTVTLVATTSKFYIKSEQAYFFSLDEKALRSCYNALVGQCMHIDAAYKEDHLFGDITVTEEKSLFFTSVPYDEGWIIEVDGKPVKPMLFERTITDEETGAISKVEQPYQDALIVLKLEPGNHQISMKYRPNAYIYGSCISRVALGVLALIVIVDYKIIRQIKKRRAKKKVAISVAPDETLPIKMVAEPLSSPKEEELPKLSEEKHGKRKKNKKK